MLRIDEIECRKAEIKELINTEGAEFDVDALTEEVRALDAEKAEIEERGAKEAELRSKVTETVKSEIMNQVEKEERKMAEVEVRNSKEYISAYANYIKTGDDMECRKLLSENASGTVAVPELVYETIKTAWDKEGIMALVKKSYLKGNLKVGFEISSDGAAIHTEGAAAINEENLVLGIVELVPASIKKWISISDEALDLQGESFLMYIYDELAYQIAKKAADTLVAKIEACGTVSTTTCPCVPVITEATLELGTVAKAIAQLSDEAVNPVIMMNKLTWAAFKKVQYDNKYSADPFEGLPVLFNNTIDAYSAATTGDTYCIVGDLGNGALANFPAGQEINFKFDDVSLATSDLVKVIGREFVALAVVAPKHFCKVQK